MAFTLFWRFAEAAVEEDFFLFCVCFPKTSTNVLQFWYLNEAKEIHFFRYLKPWSWDAFKIQIWFGLKKVWEPLPKGKHVNINDITIYRFLPNAFKFQTLQASKYFRVLIYVTSTEFEASCDENSKFA